MTGSFLFQAIIFLTAAVICVPLAKRLGMSSVLGYLLAGVLIGPYLLGFVGQEGEDLMHFAEFGVVMMLFLIGLELDPGKFWRMRRLVVGSGLIQMLLTTVLAASSFWVIGISINSAFAAGLAVSLSSTAIVLQSLKEKNTLKSSGGQLSFATLLFQDIAVIPILALLPLLATARFHQPANEHQLLPETIPAWANTLIAFSAIILVVVAGRWIVGPILREVAKTRLRELFSATALLLVVSTAFLMELVGLSPALGTFLAGMVLANSEYRHELESDLGPFKGLLLGLFFLSVGATINLPLLGQEPGVFLILLLVIMLIKSAVLWTTAAIFRLRSDQNLVYTIGMSQIGEFAFVLLSFMAQLQLLNPKEQSLGMALTAVSMAITPILMLVNEKWLLPGLSKRVKSEEKAFDDIDEKHPIIIAGFGHFGSTIGRFLRANGVDAVYLDHDSDQVELLRKMGFKVYYGDASRVDLLEAAGAHEAKILISAIDSPEANYQLVETIKKHFPHIKLFMRAQNRYDAMELMDLEVDKVYRETLDTSVRLGVEVLQTLGHRAYSASRSGRNFIKYDEEAMLELKKTRHNRNQYISDVREKIQLQERLLKADRAVAAAKDDHAWDAEPLRKAANKPN